MTFQLECRLCRKTELIIPKGAGHRGEIFVVEYLCTKCRKKIKNTIRLLTKKSSDT